MLPAPPDRPATPERTLEPVSGWMVLGITLVTFLAAGAAIIITAVHGDEFNPAQVLGHALLAFALVATSVFLCWGFFTLQPNEARVLVLFGHYRGTARRPGFHWANPFYARRRNGQALTPLGMAKLSLRANNFNTDTLKVNDKRGNPVEIAAVVTWRVGNTAQAVFDVEDYAGYVRIQSESAIRTIASRYAYDHGEEHELTLRGGAEEVSGALRAELQARLERAGIVVEDTRLSHLAYAPEIAPAMLRRQQAEAVIAARQIIVQNAVGMVRMALHELDANEVVHLDEERKAAMVSNLLVVLCGSSETTPVINTGTLYN